MKLELMMLTATLASLPAAAENLALAFDGSSQYARLEEGNGLDLSTGTIELWARLDRLYDEQCLVVRADGIATISYGLMYDTTSVAEPNRINGFVNANGVWGSTVRMVGGPTSTPPQRWVHSARGPSDGDGDDTSGPGGGAAAPPGPPGFTRLPPFA
jgi:hypothetical protein